MRIYIPTWIQFKKKMNVITFIIFLFRGIAIPVHESIYGGGSGPIHYDELACTGTENSVGSCKHSTFLDCEHSEDAGVICDKGIR